jgi:hypothetical protein
MILFSRPMYTLMNLVMHLSFLDIMTTKTSMLLNWINLMLKNTCNLLKKAKDKELFLNLLICSSMLELGIDSKLYSMDQTYKFGCKLEP